MSYFRELERLRDGARVLDETERTKLAHKLLQWQEQIQAMEAELNLQEGSN